MFNLVGGRFLLPAKQIFAPRKSNMGDKVCDQHRGYEMAPYVVELKKEGYEKRAYSSLQWSSTTIDPIKRTAESPFRRLYNYITGSNEQNANISMTVPVLMSYDGAEDKPTSRDSKHVMSFYTPKQFHDKPPQPTNSDVYLSTTPGMRIYASAYSGWTNERKEKHELQKLEGLLQKDGMPYTKGQFYIAAYESPYRLWRRRNEVWILAE